MLETVGRSRLDRMEAILAHDFPGVDVPLSASQADLLAGVGRALVLPAEAIDGLPPAGLEEMAFPAGPGRGLALRFRAEDPLLLALRRFYLPPVLLAGAGPGGIGSLTMDVAQALSRADVVLADCLCGEEILSFVSPKAEVVAVGKRSGCGASAKQEEIHRLLLVHARRGRRVVRLKGGDPAVFGRLEEEIGVLKEQGLSWRVLPGVGAGSSAAALAGQPLTVRELSSELVLSTGRFAGGGRNPFPLSPGSSPSIALYMSRKVLADRMADLAGAGYPEDTPVLVAEKVGSAEARIVSGRLGTIAETADREGVGTPAVVLVGSHFTRPDHLPLFGVRIWLPAEAETGLSQRPFLEELGATCITSPLIEPVPLPVDDLAIVGGRFDWVVFTSKKTVDFFFALLDRQGRDSRWLPLVAALGDPTMKKLRARGVEPNLEPPEPTRVSLSTSLLSAGAGGKRVLFPASTVTPDHVPERLREAGADVTRVDLFTIRPCEVKQVPEADVVLFTSQTTVHAARDNGLFPEIARRGMVVGGIGPGTFSALDAEGCPARIRPDGTDPESLARAVKRYYARRELAAFREVPR